MKKQAESLEAETQRLIELYSSGQSKEARELAAELSENFPDISVFPNVLGACCAGEGQLDLAVLHYRRALEIKPDYAEAYSNLGIAYETLRFTGKHSNNIFVKWLIIPNMALQKLTTKQPDDDQIEIAIDAMENAIKADQKDLAEIDE